MVWGKRETPGGHPYLNRAIRWSPSTRGVHEPCFAYLKATTSTALPDCNGLWRQSIDYRALYDRGTIHLATKQYDRALADLSAAASCRGFGAATRIAPRELRKGNHDGPGRTSIRLRSSGTRAGPLSTSCVGHGESPLGGGPCYHGGVSKSARVLPKIREPMAATQVAKPFHRPGWVYEEKVDGWRVLAYKDAAGVRLVSRNAKGPQTEGRRVLRVPSGCNRANRVRCFTSRLPSCSK